MFFERQYFAQLPLIALLAAWPAAGQELPDDRGDRRLDWVADSMAPSGAPASKRILEAIEEPALRELVDEILKRNPGVAAAEARARAAAQRAPQVKALPDPVASLTAFLETPETRTGPQRFSASIFQELPWAGKLALAEQAALYAAAALEAEVEVTRLAVVTEARRLYYELGFLDRYRTITENSRGHLVHHEEISRVRYSTGAGPAQGVVKLQAEITRVDSELLDVEARRLALAAQINALRDRAAWTPLQTGIMPDAVEVVPDHEALLERALRLRPELAAADARISRADTLIRLAEKGYRPDWKIGLTYTLVDPRGDASGRMQPPEGNGDDILSVRSEITLPIRRKKLAAGVEEAIELRKAAEEAKRDAVAAIEAAVGDLTRRAPLDWSQLRLVEDLLIVQAEQSLGSARAGYSAGTLNALDLLHAVHIVFETHTAVARAKADYLISLARLECAVGGPLKTTTNRERSES